MKKVLIPTDFSENAWNAIVYAMAFYNNVPVNYVLAHVIPPDGLPPVLETLHTYISGDTLTTNLVLDKLDVLKKEMLSHSNLKEKQIQITCIEANFIDGIKKIATKFNVDLIVMGTKGQSLDIDTVIGKHTSSVITKIKYPIMVIPEAASFKTPINIAFPTDYDFIYKDRVLNTLLEIVNLYESNLNVLRVVNSKLALSPFQQKNRNHLKNTLKDVSISFHRVDQPELETGIQYFIDSMNIDIITMIAKNLNFFQKLLFSPRVAKMSYHLEVPFFVLHE